jgi:phage regulator Rha-like protein
MTTSLDVARVFEWQHKNVLQAIENLECSDGFNRLNFKLIENGYQDGRNRWR